MCPDMQLDRRKTHVEKSLWLSSNFTWTHDIRVQEHFCTLVTLYGIPQPYFCLKFPSKCSNVFTEKPLAMIINKKNKSYITTTDCRSTCNNFALRIVITPKHICGISTGLMKSSYQFASRPLNSFTLWISVS